MRFWTVSENAVLQRFIPPLAIRKWWNSFESNWERATLCLLVMICATVIFSTFLVQTFVVVLSLVVLSWVVIFPHSRFRRTQLDVPYLAFILGRVVSVFFSQDLARSLPALYVEFYFYLVFFLVTQSVRRNEIAVTRLLVSVLVAAGAVAAIIGVSKVLFSVELRASSTTAGVYTLGSYLCTVLPLALLHTYIPERWSSRWMGWLIPLVICSGIVMTLDRMQWGGMVVILLAAVILSQDRRLLLFLSGSLAFFLVAPSVRLRLERMALYGDFMGGREVIWAGAFQLIAEHPIVGFGPRTFTKVFPLFDKLPILGVGSWHNDYLQVYMDSGLIGLLPLLWLVVATFYHGVRLLQSPSLLTKERNLYLSILLSLGAVFLFGGALDTHVGIVFRILLGLLALGMSQRKGETSVSMEPAYIRPGRRGLQQAGISGLDG